MSSSVNKILSPSKDIKIDLLSLLLKFTTQFTNMASENRVFRLNEIMQNCVIRLMSGDAYVIQTWNGFNMGNLLRKITEIMEKEHGEEEFNCERIIFFNKDRERIDFMDDDVLNNGDYFNVVIIDDDEEQLRYAHHEWEGKWAKK